MVLHRFTILCIFIYIYIYLSYLGAITIHQLGIIFSFNLLIWSHIFSYCDYCVRAIVTCFPTSSVHGVLYVAYHFHTDITLYYIVLIVSHMSPTYFRTKKRYFEWIFCSPSLFPIVLSVPYYVSMRPQFRARGCRWTICAPGVPKAPGSCAPFGFRAR